MPATKAPSMHHPRGRNVTTFMVGLRNDHIRKNLTPNGEPQRYSWETEKEEGVALGYRRRSPLCQGSVLSVYIACSSFANRHVGVVVWRPPRERQTWVRFPLYPGRVIPVTYTLALQWLSCRAPGVIRSALGLVGTVSVYCDWLRFKV